MSLPSLVAGVVLLVLAAITGLFGFVSGEAPLAAKVFSAYFLCCAAGALWWSRLTRTRSDAPPAR